MKVYLASHFSRRHELTCYARDLEIAGYNLACRWLFADEQPYHPDLPVAEAEGIARRCYEDVLEADILLAFTEPFGSRATGGARHAEFGIALCAGKRVWVVGEREHVLHSHPGVQVYGTWEEALAALRVKHPPGRPIPRLPADHPPANDADRFWGEYGKDILRHSAELDSYIPGLSEATENFAHCRRTVYAKVRDAWIHAGKPCVPLPADAEIKMGKPLSAVTLSRSHGDGMGSWFRSKVQIASMDHTIGELTKAKRAILEDVSLSTFAKLESRAQTERAAIESSPISEEAEDARGFSM